MKMTLQVHEVGQSIRLDSMARALPDSGTLERYSKELSATAKRDAFAQTIQHKHKEHTHGNSY